MDSIKKRIEYCKDTGIFRWISGFHKSKTGTVAGCLYNNGYLVISIEGKRYLAHRLAWYFVYGEMPKNQIDHINGVRTDNRIENLRDVTSRQNHSNRIRHQSGHLVGANYCNKQKRWIGRIGIGKKIISLGYFENEKTAHQAHLIAKLMIDQIDPNCPESKIKIRKHIANEINTHSINQD